MKLNDVKKIKKYILLKQITKEIQVEIQKGGYPKEKIEKGKNLMYLVNDEIQSLKSITWERYLDVSHHIERTPIPNIRSACQFYQELKNSILHTENFHLIKELILIIDDFSIVTRMQWRELEYIVPNPPSMEHEMDDADAVFESFVFNMKSFSNKMEKELIDFKKKCLERVSIINERIYNLMFELNDLEMTLVHQYQDAVTIFYAIRYFQELRQERRRLKNELFLYKKMTEYRLNISPKYLFNQLDSFEFNMGRLKSHADRSNYTAFFKVDKKQALEKLVI